MVLNWRNKVVENFDKKSSCYDQNNILQRTVAGEMMKDLPLLKRADADILEVGCGTGVLTRNLVHKYQGQNLRITDISPQMLEQAKTKIRGNISWTLLDAENDRIKKSYDLIVANMVF